MFVRTRVLIFAILSLPACAFPCNAQEAKKTNPPSKEVTTTFSQDFQSFVLRKLPAKEQKKWSKTLAEAITTSAHPTHGGVDTKEFGVEFDESTNLYTARWKVEYFGGFTSRPYSATITMQINPDPAAWEIKAIRFSDSNRIPANQSNLAKYKQQLNRLLDPD